MLRAAYSNTKCRYKSKAAICDELGMYCVVYVSKFDQWYRAKVLDWLSVCTFLYCLNYQFHSVFVG